MRKLAWIIAFLLLVTSLAGCDNGFGLVILGADGSVMDFYEDVNVVIRLNMEKEMVTLSTQRKNSQPTTLLWPKDNLILPDGSIYTLCYISGKYFNEDVSFSNLQYQAESGQSIAVSKRSSLAHVFNPYLFADTSPMLFERFSISPSAMVNRVNPVRDLQWTEWPRLAAIRDPQDFTAPVKHPTGSDNFFFLEALARKLKAGDKLTWVLEYRIEETGQVISRTLTLKVTAR